MESVTPSYYAPSAAVPQTRLEGMGFLTLPADAVGLISHLNDDPLVRRYATQGYYWFDLNVVSDTVLEAVLHTEHAFSGNRYFSAIVSADRDTVYWVNNTSPLPE